MNNKKEKISSGKEVKDKFKETRRKIGEIRKEELRKKEKGEKYNLHFDYIDENELIKRDFEIFKKFEDGSLSPRGFLKYQREFKDSGENDPRYCFCKYLVDRFYFDENGKIIKII